MTGGGLAAGKARAEHPAPEGLLRPVAAHGMHPGGGHVGQLAEADLGAVGIEIDPDEVEIGRERLGQLDHQWQAPGRGRRAWGRKVVEGERQRPELPIEDAPAIDRPDLDV